MSEYIDREEALKHLKLLCDLESKNVYFAVRTDDIRKIPAADVAPIIHAKWETRPSGENGSGEMKAFCSHCGKPNKQYRPPYCPHCGAQMNQEDSHGS